MADEKDNNKKAGALVKTEQTSDSPTRDKSKVDTPTSSPENSGSEDTRSNNEQAEIASKDTARSEYVRRDAAGRDNSRAKKTPSNSNSAQTGSAEPKKRSRAGLWLIILLTLLLTLALGAAGYFLLYKQMPDPQALQDVQQVQQDQQQKMAELNQQNSSLQQQLSQLQQSKQQLDDAVNQLSATSKQIQQQTEAALNQIQNMEGQRPADWLVAEADYLVRMAGRKLWLEKDIRTAIMLLVNADERLKSLSDPSVLPVREKIAQDIQTLQQINPVSRTSVALAISGMLSQIDNLALDTFERPQSSSEDEQISDSISDWKQNLLNVWHALVDDFISIQRTDTPIEPMMSEQQQWLAREQLTLQLMQAQSAALGSENTLFQQSLDNALGLINEHFDTEDPQVSGFEKSLRNLTETDVGKEFPTQLAAQAPLERLLEERVKKVFGQGASAL